MTTNEIQQGGWRHAVRSWQYPQFRWLFGSNVAFFFSMNGQFVVRSILAYDLTHSPVALGLVNLAVSIPMLCIAPIGGVVTDRVEKRRLIMMGQAVVIASECIVWALLLTGHLQFWHLLAAVFATGCAFPFIMPARQAIVAGIVGRQGLPNAMALQVGGMNMTRVVAPVTAGMIAAFFGVKPMYGVSITLYVVAFLAMSRVSAVPPERRSEHRAVLADMLEGLRYVRGERQLRILVALSLVPIMLAMPFQTLLVVFARDVWHRGNAGLGILQASAGIGGIIGSMIVAWKGETRRRLRMMMFGLFAFAGSLFAFAFSPWFLLAMPLVLLADVFANIFNTMNFTTIQVLIPDRVRGRVMSLLMMTFGLTPLGTMPVSAAAQAWGAPTAVALASVLTMLSGAAFFLLSPSLRGIDAVTRAALEEQTRETEHAEPTHDRIAEPRPEPEPNLSAV